MSTSSILFNDGAEEFIMHISGTTALTIDSNKCLYGNGTGLSHIQNSNIDCKPNNVVY